MMKISQLLKNVDIIDKKGNIESEIKDLKIDSREVVQGDLFICLKGFQSDGHQYIDEAIQKGAKAIISEKWLHVKQEGLFEAAVPNSRQALAIIANNFFNFPTTKVSLYGVTGTNGKTTTTFLIESILRYSGQKTGLIGTVKGMIDGIDIKLKNTTPEPLELQRLIAEMVNKKVDAVVMEVSSHALDMSRVDGCQFDVAVFTNLSQDHLDYHKDMEDYFRAKRLLFEYLDHQDMIKVINSDDDFGQKLLQKNKERAYTYGLNKKANFKAKNISLSQKETEYIFQSENEEFNIKLKLPGLFNVYNSLAAATACSLRGISSESIIGGLAGVTRVPGRFELVSAGQDFLVAVDYAHTPDSLEKVIKAAREITKGRVITVFGCGGDRDRSKRPLMGIAAVEGSDLSIVTSDNPRSEGSQSIIKDILDGINLPEYKNKFEVEADRRKAISKAINLAEKGDIIIIAGKGHEEGQIIGNEIVPFNDRNVAEELLREMLSCCH